MVVDPDAGRKVPSSSRDPGEVRKALAAVEEAGLDAFLDRVLAEGLEAIGATQGSLMLLNVHEGVLDVVKRRGPPYNPERMKHRRFKVGEGIAGWVAERCQ